MHESKSSSDTGLTFKSSTESGNGYHVISSKKKELYCDNLHKIMSALGQEKLCVSHLFLLRHLLAHKGWVGGGGEGYDFIREISAWIFYVALMQALMRDKNFFLGLMYSKYFIKLLCKVIL